MSLRSVSEATTTAASPAKTAEQIINDNHARWMVIHKRVAVAPAAIAADLCLALPMLTRISWPGSGTVKTRTDCIPVVTIPGMPASMYPRYIMALCGYTVADWVCQDNTLLQMINDRSLYRTALVVVATRCGAWAAVGQVPPGEETITERATRWSRKLQKIVVRPGTVDDGTALWRQCLAMHPGMDAWAGETAVHIAGVAPIMFLSGASLLDPSGEAYMMHYVEKAVHEYLLGTVGRSADKCLQLGTKTTTDTMAAAAVGGYRASVVKQISTDTAFMTASLMRAAGADRADLARQLDKVMAEAPLPATQAHSGYMSSSRDVDVEDCVSVADTETDGVTSVMREPYIESPGDATPRALDIPADVEPMTNAEADRIRAFSRRVVQGATFVPSMIAGANPDDTAVF